MIGGRSLNLQVSRIQPNHNNPVGRLQESVFAYIFVCEAELRPSHSWYLENNQITSIPLGGFENLPVLSDLYVPDLRICICSLRMKTYSITDTVVPERCPSNVSHLFCITSCLHQHHHLCLCFLLSCVHTGAVFLFVFVLLCSLEFARTCLVSRSSRFTNSVIILQVPYAQSHHRGVVPAAGRAERCARIYVRPLRLAGLMA